MSRACDATIDFGISDSSWSLVQGITKDDQHFISNCPTDCPLKHTYK